MYSPSEFCIHWGMSDKQVEVITCFSGVYSQVFTDVSVEKAMRVDHKKCDKTTAGCLEIHVHSLNDVLGLTRGK
ncbi:hypothetical protein HZB94_00100 [Candidatus Falkowbacteria bacterium]|nr:hypothetical protein [Candidatus Falkowbacteria bacterium]